MGIIVLGKQVMAGMPAKVGVVLLFLLMFSFCFPGEPGAARAGAGATLPDVSGHWSEAEVRAMAALEVIAGFPDGTFRPEEKVTRGQFLKMLVASLGWPLPARAGQSFADVPPGYWAHPYVEAAVEKGVVRPDLAGNRLEPEQPLTRLEVAEWLRRTDPRLPSLEPVPAFTDWSLIPEASRPAVEAVAGSGLLRGYPDGRFGPGETLTRAQAATVLWRFLCLPGSPGGIPALEVGAIYALRSYEQRGFLSRLDWVAFGWATLEGGSRAQRPVLRLDSPSSGYRLPPGWEEVATAAPGLLMVFCDQPEILTALLQNPAWWPEVAKEAATAVKKLGCRGLLLDFERLRDHNQWGGPGLAAAYVKFVETVRSHLPPDCRLVVAVSPPNVVGHFDGYDYAGLSHAADRLLLMAHDYHTTDQPSPPAPLPQVAEAVRMVSEAGADRSRLILGLSLTARQWVLDRQGRALRVHLPLLETVYRAAEERARAGDTGAVRFDPATQMPLFRYEKEEAGTYEKHVVWFEDLRSLSAKIALARRYGLAGVSFWRLGIIPEQLLEDLLSLLGHVS